MEVKITDCFAVEPAEEAAARSRIRPDLQAPIHKRKPRVGRPRKHPRILNSNQRCHSYMNAFPLFRCDPPNARLVEVN